MKTKYLILIRQPVEIVLHKLSIDMSVQSLPSGKYEVNKFQKGPNRNSLKKLFFGHLPKKLDEKELIDRISMVCEITSLNLIVDGKTRVPKGLVIRVMVIFRMCFCICGLS